MSPLLDFQGFCEVVADELDLPSADIDASARLGDDLGWDSLRHFELLLLVEDLADAEVPEALIGQLLTLDDFYAFYRVRAPVDSLSQP